MDQISYGYASEYQKQFKDVLVDKVHVTVAASAITPLSATWMISNLQEIKQRPEPAINGFRAAGIANVVAAVQD